MIAYILVVTLTLLDALSTDISYISILGPRLFESSEILGVISQINSTKDALIYVLATNILIALYCGKVMKITNKAAITKDQNVDMPINFSTYFPLTICKLYKFAIVKIISFF